MKQQHRTQKKRIRYNSHESHNSIDMRWKNIQNKFSANMKDTLMKRGITKWYAISRNVHTMTELNTKKKNQKKNLN